LGDLEYNRFSRMGFKFGRSGAHLSRTMMLDELTILLSYVENLSASKGEYLQAVVQDNCLGKRTGRTRILTARHLIDLYELDPTKGLFRGLRYFWKRDEQARPLLAFLCAYARDSILRMCTPFVLNVQQGLSVKREDLETFIEELEPGRFSTATLKSTAQNVNGTWTRSGHLAGRAKKVRTQTQVTPGAISYALLLGYLKGARGQLMFETEYIKTLDISIDEAIELAQQAAQHGWIVMKKIGDVIEVLFPNILTEQEVEWTHEQD